MQQNPDWHFLILKYWRWWLFLEQLFCFLDCHSSEQKSLGSSWSEGLQWQLPSHSMLLTLDHHLQLEVDAGAEEVAVVVLWERGEEEFVGVVGELPAVASRKRLAVELVVAEEEQVAVLAVVGVEELRQLLVVSSVLAVGEPPVVDVGEPLVVASAKELLPLAVSSVLAVEGLLVVDVGELLLPLVVSSVLAVAARGRPLVVVFVVAKEPLVVAVAAATLAVSLPLPVVVSVGLQLVLVVVSVAAKEPPVVAVAGLPPVAVFVVAVTGPVVVVVVEGQPVAVVGGSEQSVTGLLLPFGATIQMKLTERKDQSTEMAAPTNPLQLHVLQLLVVEPVAAVG